MCANALHNRWRAFFSLYLAGVAAMSVLQGCATPSEPEQSLIPLAVSDYPRFVDDMGCDGLVQAIGQSLVYLKRIPADREFRFGADVYDAKAMIRSLETFLTFLKQRPSPSDMEQFIRKNYRVYRAAGEPKTKKILFTGYFEPLIEGSLAPNDAFPYPVYGMPNDLAQVDLSAFSAKYDGQRISGRVDGKGFVPYYDRKEIDAGALDSKAPVLAWVRDPVALFFLHIQGSGKIALPDGSHMSIQYHAKNGRPYRSIGQLLIDEKKVSVKDMSMQAIEKYLDNHPEAVKRVLHHNPSYVFFRIRSEGPFGALNVRLTDGRAIAVDRSIYPMAALAFIQAQKPRVKSGNGDEKMEWVNFSRFVLNQDTGGAIKGSGRADIFWGSGDYAESAAGRLKHRGNLYLLILKTQK